MRWVTPPVETTSYVFERYRRRVKSHLSFLHPIPAVAFCCFVSSLASTDAVPIIRVYSTNFLSGLTAWDRHS